MKKKAAFLGIDHVQLAAPAGSEALARKFFGDVLGMQEIQKPEPLRMRGGIWFACGNQQLHIGIELDFEPARKAHPAIQVADVPALQRRLKTAGFDVIPDGNLPGVARFYTHDPFGNRIEFIEARA